MLTFTGIALVTAAGGAANLTAAVALEEMTALRSPDAWLPLTASFAGWMVARLSPRNPIAWLLLAIAVSSAIFGASALVLLAQPALPSVILDLASWLTTWVYLPSYWLSFTLLPILFPDGRLPSRHWKPVLLTAVALTAVGVVLLAFGSRETLDADIANPWHVEIVGRVLDAVAPALFATVLLTGVLGVGALVHRLLTARPGERLPLAAFGLAVAVGLAVLIITGMGLVLGLLLPLAVAGAVAHRLHGQLREQVMLLAAQAAELKASRARIVHASDTVRRRIERDLHDGAQQGLLAISVGLGRLADRVDPQLRGEVGRLRDVSQETLAGLRELASGTYPSALRELGVAAALREAVGRGARITDRLGQRPSEATEAALYFATLEAVTNALKHADASTIDVVLERTPDGGYRFLVEDDGNGITDTTPGGSGLAGMADRLAARGGTLTVERAPDRGTRVGGVAYDAPR